MIGPAFELGLAEHPIASAPLLPIAAGLLRPFASASLGAWRDRRGASVR